MDSNRYEGNIPDDYSTYWCNNCKEIIAANKNKFNGGA